MKFAYDKLLDDVCVRLGFCGSVVDDQPLHVSQFLPRSGKLNDEEFADALFKAEGWAPDGSEARTFRSSVREAFIRHMGGSEIEAASEAQMSEPDRSTYELVMGSDVADRDGMYLELNDGSIAAMPLAEVFYSDIDGSIAVSTFGNSLPLDTVEWMIAEAKRRLPPRR